MKLLSGLPAKFWRQCAAVCCASWLAVSASAAAPQAILSLPSGTAAERSLRAQVQEWRSSGTVSRALVLTCAAGPAGGPRLLAVLDFSTPAAADQWKARTGAALKPNAIVTWVTVASQSDEMPQPSAQSAFMIAQYDVLVPAPRYESYVQGYLVPQMLAWQKAGILARYALFSAVSGSSPGWQSLLLMEYSDQKAAAQRDKVKDAARQQLAATDPKWESWSKIKSSIRTEKSLVAATAVDLTAP